MPLITDPDFLGQAEEVVINVTEKTIELFNTTKLSTAGVTGQALYSFLKEEWKTDANLIPYPFPMISITTEQFEFIEGWKPKDNDTRNLLRFAGWREIDGFNNLDKQFMNITSLGNIGASNTAYHAFTGDTQATDFSFAGPVNQAIQVYDSGVEAGDGGFDNRALVLTTFIRNQGQLYGSANTTSIGLTGLNYIANRFPLGQAPDTKITADDTTIATNEPYQSMTITYGAITRTIGGTARSFDILINGNNGTAEEIYEFVQWSLRLETDIDTGIGTQIGKLTAELLAFSGNTLKTKTGVYIDNFQAADTNRIIFTDTGGTERTFPFVAAGTISFNQNLVDDTDATYHMFFTDTFGTANSTIVEDNSGQPITGNVGGASSVAFDFDYDGNTQQSRTDATDVGVTVVAIGLGSAQYVVATGTLQRTVEQNISLVAPLERNYSNET
jgi:hypothetical protein